MSSPYTDLDRPPLNARRLAAALVTEAGPWTRLDLRAQTGSTNADAVSAARAGEPEGLVVVAEAQTEGRGRRGRAWTSPPRAGITTSVLLRPGVAVPEREWPAAPPAAYGWLPLLAGVALVETVNRLAEVPAVLKWPNDLMVGDLKCAGILAEGVPNGDAPAVAVGIGLNVTLRAGELPPDRPATSLQLAGAAMTDRDPLLRALLRGLGTWYGRWRFAGGDAEASGLAEAYRHHCGTIGRSVRVSLPSGAELAGEVTTVDADGQLVVRTAEGRSQSVAAGDVLYVR
ncbi:biotin--[acetyl-CoA-carboxylase] ligase [Phytohabitans sp. ZYX-F-186]|uniref:biotin--[biotin carboxyl-carrier protein] ligase n=1 Tax=Phytohabitans maris TaxID=3071409 RepID=A0ABU0ZWH7_9ACTN|nr:biotin--[acetyl-CoA-carboxylase] ligase [Phytohabitans sp. ZYX-F-186]MDQ7911381.1 biotin--[acetyl-CoA-carboxylase] ligase [Phytohabitans sp. ZYX-F-186]